jgi:hypothetical protein
MKGSEIRNKTRQKERNNVNMEAKDMEKKSRISDEMEEKRHRNQP